MEAELDLGALALPYDSVCVVGMAKNVGKTTTLNKLVSVFNKEKIRLGLTSIGRDGESVDLVTATEKPRIFVRAGTIIATAVELLNLCDITKEILDVTDINTSMGRACIVRALSDGFVQLGGPSMTAQIADIIAQMRALGAVKIIVDGAVDRRTLADPAVTNAAVLCAGASMRLDLDTVVKETAHVAGMLALPKAEDPGALAAFARAAPGEKIERVSESIFCAHGALSDGLVEGFVMSGSMPEGALIVAQDPSKIYIKAATYEQLLLKKARLAVANPINLIAITVNPVSAYGGGFDGDEFLRRMRLAVKVPVFDLKAALKKEGECLSYTARSATR